MELLTLFEELKYRGDICKLTHNRITVCNTNFDNFSLISKDGNWQLVNNNLDFRGLKTDETRTPVPMVLYVSKYSYLVIESFHGFVIYHSFFFEHIFRFGSFHLKWRRKFALQNIK